MIFLPLKILEKEIDNLIQDKFWLVNFHDNLWKCYQKLTKA